MQTESNPIDTARNALLNAEAAFAAENSRQNFDRVGKAKTELDRAESLARGAAENARREAEADAKRQRAADEKRLAELLSALDQDHLDVEKRARHIVAALEKSVIPEIVGHWRALSNSQARESEARDLAAKLNMPRPRSAIMLGSLGYLIRVELQQLLSDAGVSSTAITFE